VSQPAETFGLEQIVLHHSYKKMAGKTVRIPCRERTHLSGDNGAGKTTILSLIPVFYGEEPERLVSKAGNKVSFLEFYLPSPQSMIVFEYTQQEGFCCVVLYRNRSNKLCYRFLRGAVDDTVFSESMSERLREGASAQEVIDLLKDSNVRVSRQILTIQDYRAIIQRDPDLIRRKGADSRSLKAEAGEFGLGGPQTQMRYIHKLTHVVLNKNNLMGNFKTMICETMFQDIHLNSAPIPLDADSLISEIRSIKAFSRETSRIRQCLIQNNERLALMDEVFQVKLDMQATLTRDKDRLELKESELSLLKERIEELETEFREQQGERIRKIGEARTSIEQLDKRLNQLHETYAECQEKELPEKVEALKTLPDMKKSLAETTRYYELITSQIREYQERYNQDVAKLKADHAEWLAKCKDEISNKMTEHGKAETKKAEALSKIDRDSNRDILETTEARQSGREKLLGQHSKLEGLIENGGYLESEQELIDNALREVEKADAYHQEADTHQKDAEEKEEQARKDHDAALTRQSQAKNGLEGKTRARDALLESLNPEPGSWLDELRNQDPDWGRRLGRIIDPELLKRKDLNPILNSDSAVAELIMGWQLELDAIDIPAFADSEGRIKERIERANQEIQVAVDQLAEADQALRKVDQYHAQCRVHNDKAKVQVRQKAQLLSTQRRQLNELKKELKTTLEGRKRNFEAELAGVKGQIKRYNDETAEMLLSIKERYGRAHLESKNVWDEQIQTFEGQVERLRERIQEGVNKHQSSLKQRHNTFLKVVSDEGLDAEEVNRTKTAVEQYERRIKELADFTPAAEEYQRWLAQEWSQLESLNSRYTDAKGMHDRLTSEDTSKEQEFKNSTKERRARHKSLKEQIGALSSATKSAVTIMEKIPEAGKGVEGREGNLKVLTATLQDHFNKLVDLKKTVMASYRSAQRVIHNYHGTQIHKTWDDIMQYRQAMMPSDEDFDPEAQTLRHVEGLRILLDSNLPQLESAAREHFANEAGKLVAYFEGLQNLHRKVKQVGAVLDRHINTNQKIESLENIRIVLTPKIQDEISWAPLKNFSESWKDWAPVNQRGLPNDEILGGFQLVQNDLREANIGTDIRSMVDLYIALTEDGREGYIRSEVDFEESSSRGLSYLAIMVIFMGVTRFLCPDERVRIIWPIDELATLSNNNIPRLAAMLEEANLTMMSACPDMNRALSRFFDNKLYVQRGKIIEFTDDETMTLNAQKRSELKQRLAMTEGTLDV
jgi:hypothetical protein